MSLLDTITGGENKKAEADLQNALAQIGAVQTPTADQLKLSQLSQYFNTGELNPATMEAAQTGPSAFDAENLSSVPTSVMQQVLAQEQELASSNGMTPQERARIAEAESGMNRAVAGQRGAIAQDFAGRGIPQSLIAAALENGTVGQNAQQAYTNALQAQSGAADNAQNARVNAGNLAGTMFNQNAGQANTVAAAQNALNQFNTANTQQANLSNQANQQAANVYGTTNKQNIANENVTGQHQVQINNQVEAPKAAAELALQKANALAGIGGAQASQATATGQQSAGLASGLLGAGATLGAAGIAAAEGGEIPPKANFPATAFLEGGPVRGVAPVAGNDPRNDVVNARLSPGEVVLPRTVAQNPGPNGSNVGRFLAQKVPEMARKMDPHPSDISSLLKALSILRAGA